MTRSSLLRGKRRSEQRRPKFGVPDHLGISLIFTVTYYHSGKSVRINNDNWIKPIQDALIGLVYDDDRLITDTVVRKTSIDGYFRIRSDSRALLEAFSQGEEFLHIIVGPAPSHEKPHEAIP